MTPEMMVREFHQKTGAAINVSGIEITALRRLRSNLIDEEANEVCEKLDFNYPLEEIAKELADLLYVTYGTAISFGINLDEAFRRVHLSNMSKLEDMEVREDGKVLKGPNYQPPDMTGVVNETR